MNIIVCVKQVPDTTEVKLDPKTGTLIRTGVPSIINPDDKNAIEEAIRIKDEYPDVTVKILCMGPPQADVAMREALAMGADEAYLISDRAYAGSDTWATSNVIAAGIRYLGDYDLIFCGRQAIDGDTAQVGPQIAERLDIPQVTYVQKADIKGDTVTVQRALEDGYQVISLKMPCLLTMIKELNAPRYPSVGGIFNAYEKEVVILSQKELNVSEDLTGLKSSPTNVNRTFSPDPKGAGVLLEGTEKEMVTALLGHLHQKHIL